MKYKLIAFLSTLLVLGCSTSCASDKPEKEPETDNAASYFDGKKVLTAYFSWSGTTQRMAQQIHDITGGDLFQIEPVVPYPTE